MATVEDKVKEHFARYPARQYAKGQILIHAGDAPQHIYYLTEGRVRQYDISYRGDETIVNVFKPGAFFPMLWAMTGKSNRYFFGAETDITVHIASAEETLEYIRQNPDVTYDLLVRVYKGLDGVLGRMVQLMSGSAKTRVLFELVTECKRFGETAEDGSCFIATKESDVAARAGLSRETVSREIRKISKTGLVKVSHRGISIRSLAELEKTWESSL